MSRLNDNIQSSDSYAAVQAYLPEDHSRRQSINDYVQQLYANLSRPVEVLDLGCGEGSSSDFFHSLSPQFNWHGVDIEHSPEVAMRSDGHENIHSFDGVNLPFPDKHFDLIYCKQVLEHVRQPDALIKDAFRVLKPEGVFVGSVSYLEPYHSFSIFNFTPYGIVRTFTDNGFELKEIRPGQDALLFINRQLLNKAKPLRFLWGNNYLHLLVDLIGWLFRLGQQQRNFLKLQFAGHLAFMARRPSDPG